MKNNKKEQITQFILNEIRQTRLIPNDRIYSRHTLMEKFNCARRTVDKAIEDLVKSRMLITRKGDGTFVASPPKRKTTDAIAVVASILGHPSMPQDIIQGFMESMGPARSIKFFTYHELLHPKSWQACKSQQGIVFIMPDMQHSPFLIEVRREEIPHVAVYRDIVESSFISIDNEGGTTALVDHLVGMGHRKIAYLGHRISRFYFPEQRYIGYLKGMFKNRLHPQETWHLLAPSRSVKKPLGAMFETEPPTALIVDQQPLGEIIQYIQNRGLTIGRDFELAHFDFVPADRYSFRIHSLRPIIREAGQAAARIIVSQLNKPDKLVQQYITPIVA
jgi:LacI family transcriptional regulator